MLERHELDHNLLSAKTSISVLPCLTRVLRLLASPSRFFDGKMISAVYLDENQYNAKFPDALGKETPLPPP